MPRPTMSTLILKLRTLINDPIGDDQVWTDDWLQQTLDSERVEVRYLPLTPLWSYLPNSQTAQTKEYLAPCGDWEADAQLLDWQYVALTPSASDVDLGRWEFAAHTPIPVYLNGKAFNLYAAAARVLENWAAQEKLNHDLNVSQKSLSESQKHQMLLAQAAAYRAQSRMWFGLSLPASVGGSVGTGSFISMDFIPSYARGGW